MAHVYIEQNYAQQLKVNKKTASRSVIFANTDNQSAGKQKQDLFEKANLWVQRSRQRRQLSQLDARLLEDMGLSKAMVEKEVAKPFWKK